MKASIVTLSLLIAIGALYPAFKVGTKKPPVQRIISIPIDLAEYQNLPDCREGLIKLYRKIRSDLALSLSFTPERWMTEQEATVKIGLLLDRFLRAQEGLRRLYGYYQVARFSNRAVTFIELKEAAGVAGEVYLDYPDLEKAKRTVSGE